MFNKTIKLKIFSPAKEVYENEVSEVTIPTKDGEITVLPNHTPIISALDGGELVARHGKQETSFFVYGGVVEVRPNSEVIILTDESDAVTEISTDIAKVAYERALKLAEEAKRKSDVDYAVLENNLRREFMKLKIGNKYRK